jgi:hypothetical protein
VPAYWLNLALITPLSHVSLVLTWSQEETCSVPPIRCSDSIAGDTCFHSRLSACVGERCSSAHVRRCHNLDILLCAQSQQSLTHGEIDITGRSVGLFRSPGCISFAAEPEDTPLSKNERITIVIGGVQNHRQLPIERVKLWSAELIMVFAVSTFPHMRTPENRTVGANGHCTGCPWAHG